MCLLSDPALVQKPLPVQTFKSTLVGLLTSLTTTLDSRLQAAHVSTCFCTCPDPKCAVPSICEALHTSSYSIISEHPVAQGILENS